MRRRKEEAELFAKPVEDIGLMPQQVDEPPSQAATVVSTLYESRSLWATLVAIASTVGGVITDTAKRGWDWLMWVAGIFPDVKEKTNEAISTVQEVAGWFSFNVSAVLGVVAAVSVVVVVIRHAQLRLEAKS